MSSLSWSRVGASRTCSSRARSAPFRSRIRLTCWSADIAWIRGTATASGSSSTSSSRCSSEGSSKTCTAIRKGSAAATFAAASRGSSFSDSTMSAGSMSVQVAAKSSPSPARRYSTSAGGGVGREGMAASSVGRLGGEAMGGAGPAEPARPRKAPGPMDQDQEGIVVSSPVLPSSIGTMAVRHPLAKVTTIRFPCGSAEMAVISLPNLPRA